MGTLTFTNNGGMNFVDNGYTFATLNVFGVSGAITNVSLSLNGVIAYNLSDLDVLLLGPGNASNLIVMSDAAGNDQMGGGNLSFSDSASAGMINAGAGEVFEGGTFQPTDFTGTETMADFGLPAGALNHSAPAGGATFGSAFDGLSAAGDWTLYVRDDAATGGSLSGSLASWSLSVTTSANYTSFYLPTGGSTIVFNTTGAYHQGEFTINGEDPVRYSSITDFTIVGSSGDDVVFAGDTFDTIIGGAGRDLLFGNGGADDFPVRASYLAVGEIYDGGDGLDELVFTSEGVTIDMRNVTIRSFERISLSGYTGGTTFFDVAFNASQFGPGVSTTALVFGSTLADTIRITMGASTSLNLSGLTVYSFSGAFDEFVFTGDGSAETITGTMVRDTIVGNGGVDILSGFSGADSIQGGAGGDTLNGDAGNDRLYGLGSGVSLDTEGDTLNGGADNDWLFGGAGGDSLTGGTEGDWFAFDQAVPHAGDTILDYATGDFLFFGGVGGAASVAVSGADLIVNGVTVTGGASRDVVVFAQASSFLLSNQTSIDALLAGDTNQLGTYGDYARTTYDGNNSSTWRIQVDYFTSSNLLDVQWTYNDAGQFHAQLFTDFDQAAANAWNYRINYYTAPGVLDYQWTYNDAGNPIHSLNTDFDQANAATWSYRITYYSALNVADYQWTYNDAGNPVHSIMHDWDQASAATWTTRTTYYSAANVADYQWTYHDAGQPWHSTYVDWDQANVETWAYHVINFSAPGVVANDYYV